jgi:hypothetical protein
MEDTEKIELMGRGLGVDREAEDWIEQVLRRHKKTKKIHARNSSRTFIMRNWYKKPGPHTGSKKNVGSTSTAQYSEDSRSRCDA